MNFSASADLAAAPPLPVTSVVPGIELIRTGFLWGVVGVLGFEFTLPATRPGWLRRRFRHQHVPHANHTGWALGGGQRGTHATFPQPGQSLIRSGDFVHYSFQSGSKLS